MSSEYCRTISTKANHKHISFLMTPTRNSMQSYCFKSSTGHHTKNGHYDTLHGHYTNQRHEIANSQDHQYTLGIFTKIPLEKLKIPPAKLKFRKNTLQHCPRI